MESQGTAHGVPRAKAYHYIGDFFNTLKAFVGTNYLALPFAFMQSGLMLGIGGVLIIAIFTDYCCNLLIKCKYKAIDHVIEEASERRNLGVSEVRAMRLQLERNVGYGDLGGMVLGRWCRILIDIAVAFTQFLCITCYFIFLGNAFFTLFPAEYAMIPVNTSHPVYTDVLPQNASWYHQSDRLATGVRMLDIYNIGKHYDSPQAVPSENLSPDMTLVKRSVDLIAEFPVERATVSPLAVDPNTSTTLSPNTTIAPNTTTQPPITTPLPDPRMYIVYLAPDMAYLVMIPVGFFLLTSLIRKLRWLSPFTIIATLTLFGGAISVFVFLVIRVIENGIAEHVEYVKLATLPLFIGQLIGAYEGIGCILPIESSMEGNRHVFPRFLHGAVFVVWIILTSFGVIGYLGYGDHVQQIIIRSLSSGTERSLLVLLVNITLIVSVFCTYPLQAYPFIMITENYIFGTSCCCCNPHALKVKTVESEDEEDLYSSINADERATLMDDASSEVEEVTVHVPPTTPAWQRNILRILLTFIAMGCGVWLRDSFAIVSSFSGAVGASLLAYILPCLIHLELTKSAGWKLTRVIDIIIIVLAVSASLMTIIVIILKEVDPKIMP